MTIIHMIEKERQSMSFSYYARLPVEEEFRLSNACGDKFSNWIDRQRQVNRFLSNTVKKSWLYRLDELKAKNVVSKAFKKITMSPKDVVEPTELTIEELKDELFKQYDSPKRDQKESRKYADEAYEKLVSGGYLSFRYGSENIKYWIEGGGFIK